MSMWAKSLFITIPVLKLIFLLALSINIEGAGAFRCYVCNSNNDVSCSLSPPPKNLIQDCNQLQNVDNKTYSLCRLMVVEVEERRTVDRRCGWIQHHDRDSCVNEPRVDIKAINCECRTEECNAGFSKSADALVLLGCTTAVYLVASIFKRF
ncbi:uncharacterized protein LOC111261959 isoform X2 [Varroa jacobsoni]|uniref:Protein sleepless n=1 Tax=Varroa destructor TaxID=109461 RepID=A0A7M7JZ76_VARDE|nr:uncharacterized protein LOC111248956 isoform X1 [Varroa destructor]XP_022691617.1 uncharacterized protein LOC111261959 isoform X2 [Varroa jacobsoni]